MATDVMIEARDLSKRYGTYSAIDRLNFSIRRGEVVGFLGPNGAGKSTTMSVLTCFIAPSSGTAKVGGNDVFENPLAVRTVVGYLPQRAPLYHEMGVVEYLQFVANLRAIPTSEHRARIKKVIEICGLGDALLKDSIGELSKGYQQRVGLAQALLHDPPILILDEPTSDLDPIEKAEFIEYIRAIGKDRTVMLSTHNLAEVEASCPRVLIVSKGKLAADGAPSDLANRSGKARYVTRDRRQARQRLGRQGPDRGHDRIADAVKTRSSKSARSTPTCPATGSPSCWRPGRRGHPPRALRARRAEGLDAARAPQGRRAARRGLPRAHRR